MTSTEFETDTPQETKTVLDTLLTLTESVTQLPDSQKKYYIQESRKQIETEYRTIIPATNHIVQSDETIMKCIQRIAFLYEQMYVIWGQEQEICRITNQIVQDLKAKKFPRSKYVYVYDALYPFRNKYSRPIDHSSIRSADNPADRLENFSSINAQTIHGWLQNIKNHYSVDSLSRRDNQDLQADLVDLAKHVGKQMLERHIPIAEIDPNEDTFNFKKETSAKEDAIRYPPTIPAKTVLSESISSLADTLKECSKIVEEEGVMDPLTGKQLITEDELKQVAESFQAMELIFKPVLDRKYKRSFFDRFKILKVADERFKRSAAKQAAMPTLEGDEVALTREIVGSWQTDRKVDFNKMGMYLFRLADFFTIWYAKVRIPRGALQSRQLSPKLSESAFGRE